MSWYISEQAPVYLDYNATTPLDSAVETSIVEGLKLWANPSSDNVLAHAARDAIEEARKALGALLHVTAKEVIFTSGGTETNNWVITAAIEAFRSAHRGDGRPHIVTSTIEHPSISVPLLRLRDRGDIDLTLVPVDQTSGRVVPSDVGVAIRPTTCLVSIMMANNETGVVQPISDIADETRRAADRFGTRVFLHSDAAQAIGKMDVDLNALKVDAVTVVGHKFYAPRNGALVIRNRHSVEMAPLLFGGGQEEGWRPGTENTPMIMGLGTAARVSKERLDEITLHLTSIRDYFEQQLQVHLAGAHVVHFAGSPRLPNTSSVAFPKYDGNGCELLEKCKSFQASTGAACHTGTVSSILTACGVSYELASKTIRFSFGRETTREEVDRVIKELKAMVFFSKFGSSLLNQINKGPIAGF